MEAAMADQDDLIRKRQQEILKKTPNNDFNSTWESLKRGGESFVKGAVGVATGVGEAMNPLAIPNSLEVLARAPFQDVDQSKDFTSRIGERFEKARKSAWLPEARIEQIAPGIRTGVRAVGQLATGEIPKLGSIYSEEVGKQEAFKESLPAGSQEAGEIGTGLLSLGMLAKQGITAIKTLAGKAKGLKPPADIVKRADEALSNLGAIERKGPQKVLREMTGPLPVEIENAIINRTSNVQAILNDPNAKNSVFESVEGLRKNLADAKELIGQSVGNFRRLLGQNNTTKFETDAVLDLLKQAKNDIKTASGNIVADAGDVNLINKYETLLKNPTLKTKEARNFITVGDTIKIIDQLDADLQPFYTGKKYSVTLKNLSDLRKAMDGDLAQMYVPYKQVKGLYEQHLDSVNKIDSKIKSTGAESFLSNLYGANKTEAQLLVQDAIKQGNEAAKSLTELSKDITTGTRTLNKRAMDLVTQIREQAASVKMPDAKVFMDDLADKLAARRLTSLSDKDADEIQRLVNAYVGPRKAIAAGAGGTVLAALGLKLGGYGGGAVGGYLGSKVAGGLADISLTAKAKRTYDLQNVLNRIQESKSAPGDLKKFITDSKIILEKFGDDTYQKFLNAVHLKKEWANAIGQVAPAANLPKPLGTKDQTIEFKEPSLVIPRAK